MPPPASPLAQVPWLTLKGPVAARVTDAIGYWLALVMVTVCGALGWFTPITVEKVTSVGLAERAVASWPDPFIWIDAAVTPIVEEEKARVAAIEPVAAGVKVTSTVQLPALFSVAPVHVLLLNP